MHHDDTNFEDPTAGLLDEEARLTRLVVHLSKLVNRGGRVVEQTGYRAVVTMPVRQQMVPNIVMSIAGIALFLWLGDAFFLIGAGVALLGWHRKLVAGAKKMTLSVRVDDLGEVSERVLESA